MPDKRTHRGPSPQDSELFEPKNCDRIRRAVEDYSLLMTKGYAVKSALKLVGDRFSLRQRQRLAVMRSACSDNQLAQRKENQVEILALKNDSLAIDGYNILITIEAALSGGLIFKGRDGCLRDLASLHGTYRKVTETIPALKLIIDFVNNVRPSEITLLLDRPVSNSGKLKQIIELLLKDSIIIWNVKLVQNPDKDLISGSSIVASSDSVILDNCRRWINLADEIIMRNIPSAQVIDLSVG